MKTDESVKDSDFNKSDYNKSGQFELKTKKNSIALNPEMMISPNRQKGIKSPLPKITDSLSNYDKAAFLKKINAMKNLK